MCVFAVFAHFQKLPPGRQFGRQSTKKGRYGYERSFNKFYVLVCWKTRWVADESELQAFCSRIHRPNRLTG
jgi:hypothetical protein